jgi:amino acid transporter
VCLVFGEIVSQFPISGGLYPWARRLVGKRWAWMAGWVYLWALCTTIAAVAVGGAPYLTQVFGVKMSHAGEIWTAVGMIVATTLLNVSGTKLLGRVAMFGFVCELVGAVLVGSYLLLFARHQSFGVLFQSFGLGSNGHYLPAFLASSVAAMFAYYGFEACGDVAEETPNPGTAIPKAMRMTIYIGGAAAILVCLALVLAVAVVLVSFFSCLLSLQAATSRLLFAYARDGMIFGSKQLSRLSPRTHMPILALLVAGFAPALIAIAGLFLEDAVRTIIVFGSAGIYVAFQMIVLGALFARYRGWIPSGDFRLGAWAWLVNIAALVYGLAAIVNMVWPRSPLDPWYINYGMILTTIIVVVSGFLYMTTAKPYEHGTAPAGDAHLVHVKKS